MLCLIKVDSNTIELTELLVIASKTYSVLIFCSVQSSGGQLTYSNIEISEDWNCEIKFSKFDSSQMICAGAQQVNLFHRQNNKSVSLRLGSQMNVTSFMYYVT